VILLLFVACTGTTPAEEPCDACGGECTETTTPATGRQHVEGTVDYPDYPPSSGNHNPCWADWGVHTDPVPTENWVHNLEHGGVVFLYDPTLDAADIDALTTFVGTLPEGRALLTPATAPMDGTVAAMSWEHRILLGCLDTDALSTFFWDHVGSAPEDLTSNASATCSMDEDTGGDTAAAR
jgi:hypothetical protein